MEQSNIQIHCTKLFMKKKIVRWISIQQLIIYDVMSLNNLRSTDHKQSRSVATYANDERNRKIWFLSTCCPNMIFFVLIWKQSNSQSLFWLIIIQHADCDKSNEYKMLNLHIISFFLRISVIICWQIFFIIFYVLCMVKSFIHNYYIIQFWFWFLNHLYVIHLFDL